MEQGRGEEDSMKQQQDHQHRRSKPPDQNPPQQPQKCPRCESLNTKFCYYNNYSLSQPRYFCKTCRRYWTQGGTIRNVPVGGGCRKGKRAKASTSTGDSSRSQPSRPQTPPPQPQNLMVLGNSGMPTTPAPRTKETSDLGLPFGIPPVRHSYYSGGGFLSSLAAMQSFTQPQAFNQTLGNLGGQFSGASSNLGLLQGLHLPPLRPQHVHQPQQSEFYQMGNREKSLELEPSYSSDQSLQFVESTRPNDSWTQSFINSGTNPNTSSTSFWNSSSTSNTTTSGPSGTSLNPSQWPDDLQGYGPPP